MLVEEVEEEGFGTEVFDSRLQSLEESKQKHAMDKRRVLDFLGDILDGPWDMANLKVSGWRRAGIE